MSHEPARFYLWYLETETLLSVMPGSLDGLLRVQVARLSGDLNTLLESFEDSYVLGEDPVEDEGRTTTMKSLGCYVTRAQRERILKETKWVSFGDAVADWDSKIDLGYMTKAILSTE